MKWFVFVAMSGITVAWQAKDPCKNGVHNCSHICISGANFGFRCACPDRMYLADDHECVCDTSRRPQKVDGIVCGCMIGSVQCANGVQCIPDYYVCDGDNDCDDGSDELSCETCPKHLFKCPSDGKCIPKPLRCDHVYDCADGMDEEDCGEHWTIAHPPTAINLQYDRQQNRVLYNVTKSTERVDVYLKQYNIEGSEIRKETMWGIPIQPYSDDWISELLPCTKYLMGIGIQFESPTNLLRLRTAYDPLKAPINVEYQLLDKYLIFTWDHSCSLRGEHPEYYLFKAHDLITNETTIRSVQALYYRFEEMRRGAKYLFTISTMEENAETWNLTYTAPPLPRPIIEYSSPLFNGTKRVLNWTAVSYQESKFVYEVLIININTKEEHIYAKTEANNCTIDLLDLSNYGYVRTGVRIRTEEGYTSEYQ